MSQTITILGAGAMGSALTTPATQRGHDVRLWGTWLDGELLDAVRAGRFHPRIGVRLDERAKVFDADQLARSLDGADLAVLAISSDGVLEVARRMREHLPAGIPVAMTTKGFGDGPDGSVALLPPLLAEVLGADTPLVAIGGPCKANEVGAGRPTATTYASMDPVALDAVAGALETPVYRIERSSDVPGLELAAAMKNVYAIGLGICDGLEAVTDAPWHNLKSAVFARAIHEMRLLIGAYGGDPETAYGLPGVGDLEVTGLSGRNKVYGEHLGRGQDPGAALEEMRASGQVVEGVPALRYAVRLAQWLGSRQGGPVPEGSRQGGPVPKGAGAGPEPYPLLDALADIVERGADPVEALSAAALPPATVNPAVTVNPAASS